MTEKDRSRVFLLHGVQLLGLSWIMYEVEVLTAVRVAFSILAAFVLVSALAGWWKE